MYSSLKSFSEVFPKEWKFLEENNSGTLNYILFRIKNEETKNVIYPSPENVFNVFKMPLENIKVVLLGQDPYINGEANGYSFSVNDGVKIPPSLKNIFKELNITPTSGNLSSWVNQGVFLLNKVLTVSKGLSNSHETFGWKTFTTTVIQIINDRCSNIVFILLGRKAQEVEKFITKKHLVLSASHPSPLSAHTGFFGEQLFEKCNEYLIKYNKNPIDWKMLN